MAPQEVEFFTHDRHISKCRLPLWKCVPCSTYPPQHFCYLWTEMHKPHNTPVFVSKYCKPYLKSCNVFEPSDHTQRLAFTYPGLLWVALITPTLVQRIPPYHIYKHPSSASKLSAMLVFWSMSNHVTIRSPANAASSCYHLPLREKDSTLHAFCYISTNEKHMGFSE